MSSLIRSAKLGRDWTINDLLAFNIQVVPKDYPNFFGIDRLPPPAVSPLILHHETMPVYLKDIPKHHKNRSDWKFYQLLSDIIHPSPGQEPPVDDFAMFLLDMMDFDEGERVTRRWREMSFVMCGQRVSAETDVCVMQTINETATYYILLVLKGKGLGAGVDTEAHFIASACAAFSENNDLRSRLALPALESMTFPAVTFVGSTPTFYKITVTEELLLALASAQYPATPTIVERLVPPVPDLVSFHVSGMLQVNNRLAIFKCFQAFQHLVRNIDIDP